MNALILSAEVQADIERVRDYAETHVWTSREILEVIQGKRRHAGEDPHHCLTIPLNFRVVYTIEDQPEPVGRTHHFSISVNTVGPDGALQASLPHPAVVE